MILYIPFNNDRLITVYNVNAVSNNVCFRCFVDSLV